MVFVLFNVTKILENFYLDCEFEFNLIYIFLNLKIWFEFCFKSKI